MSAVETLLLFVLAAVARDRRRMADLASVREHRGLVWVGAGIAALAAEGFRPDRDDLIGAAVCLIGVGVIIFAPC